MNYFPTGDWLAFFNCLLRVANPTIPPQKGWMFYPVGNIRDEIRNALRHVYHNTSLRLLGSQGEKVKTNKYHQLWAQLGHNYVIEGHDNLTRIFFRAQRRCCNLQCFRAAYEIEHLQKCRKCKDTFYCSKECQKL
ncbi:hypothetical protein CPB83DRAFT_305472 [Crepidotus variabilis]|uniref:MYND-type domain-containing protein n=1 Tax=Crepidotus variabilis TaxID=179855 RepID=A0A9P6EH62_9AGAR|nr:hypothetical protein CPB83DRAFT_305472 [Crepidotus variabilis]